MAKAFLVFPVDIQKGRMKWLLITDNNRTIGDVSDRLEKCGCDVKIDRITPLSEKGILTQRQEAAIRIAFSSGYFDYPRRISGLKLANKLGISMSTLSEIMRTAQRRIFAEYLKT
jgi:predicted DNA binding protein